MISVRLGLMSLLCVACFKPQGKAEEGGGTEGSSEAGGSNTSTSAVVTTTGGLEPTTGATPTTEAVTTVSGSTTTEAGDTTTIGSSSGGEESTGEVMAICGNGELERGEKCDDGNVVGGDQCPADCKDPCGNGVIDGGEKCDDGNTNGGDGCSDGCERDAAYVFVTSTSVTADFGGVAVADAKCQELAIAAGLPGAYKAWLSSGGDGAYARIVPVALPYIRPDGKLVAESFAAIVLAGPEKLLAAIEVTEAKATLKGAETCSTDAMAWTGTDEAGVPSLMSDCGAWTLTGGFKGVAGNINATDGKWTSGCPGDCSREAHLYCFETAG